MESVSKVLLIGSGGIKIAEAAEFDYSGSQALKALKGEGITTILVNPNIATIQTTHLLADRVYLAPITVEYLEKIIEREQPDGIMVGFGGQSALSVGVQLYRKGVLDKYSVKVLGTPIEGIEAALTRSIFRETMIKAGLPVPPSQPANSIKEAMRAADEVGYPVIVRVSFNLGGRGSFVAYRREELEAKLTRAFSHSIVGNVLIEKYLEKWKEIEYEVMRDRAGNMVAVACLENIDPMGVHTGESLVVAPSQTLTDSEYQTLRSASFGVASAIRLVGECNVQLALQQGTGDYYVIETNPRMSRSSALASKATGYPLAYIAAKLCLGYLLDELLNTITGSTTAFFEPSLDYVVLKAPRWDLDKFWPRDEVLGSEMMSIGEVMAIGRNMEEVYQKAFRMLDIGVMGLVDSDTFNYEDLAIVMERLKQFRPYWLRDVAKALYLGATVEQISSLTGVDEFFLKPVERIVNIAKLIRRVDSLSQEAKEVLFREALKAGFTAEQIATISGKSYEQVKAAFQSNGWTPWLKNIDTLAGEKPAMTNYSYTTYSGMTHDVLSRGHDALLLVLGAGCFRIGVSVEFDWGTVNIYKNLKEFGKNVAIINYNPETVSTDWDIVDFLINSELTPEAIQDIASIQSCGGVIISSAGQIGNNVAEELDRRGVPILGTQPSSVGRAENRSKFSKLLEELGIEQPRWATVTDLAKLPRIAEEVGYPVILRPSYILSGTSVFIAYDEDELKELMGKLSRHTDKPVVVSHFIEDAVEAEVDCVSDGSKVLMLPMDHVEYAGVHSGDATISIPPYRTGERTIVKIAEYTGLIAKALQVRGPFNIQYLVKNGQVYVIECNLRCSRSMPFSSKVYNIDLLGYGTRCILGEPLSLNDDRLEEIFDKVYAPLQLVWGVKSPQFSWAQIRGSYPFLGPEMRSTGEVAAVGLEFHEALMKSWLSATPNTIPPKDVPILVYPDSQRTVPRLKAVAEVLRESGYEVLTLEESPIPGVPEIRGETAVKAIRLRRIGTLISSGYIPQIDYDVRRAAVDHNIPVILNAELALEISKALKMLTDRTLKMTAMELGELWEINRQRISPLLVGRKRDTGELR
ncbi:Carbamoyl-phosphate synthase large chain [Candidatus Calditenuaceae archaeon HR02]|nr:Carbamoyl-phosphate synthase large chain [Candidatus Calditenuaceae archaeon HR02]